jgi:NAD-dependent dihydropyrimidine dehydrogenase PreA subunit
MAHIITEACIETKDKACLLVCPANCIAEGKQQLYIDPSRCVDCGACISACPMSAIFPADQVPTEWHGYIDKNRLFFEAGA